MIDDQALPDNIKHLLKNIQPGELYFTRQSALKNLAKVDKSYPAVVEALMAVVKNEGNTNIGKLASAALATPAHQEILKKNPDQSTTFLTPQKTQDIQGELFEGNELQTSVTPRTGFKKCPFCAEEIRAEAIVCRYCGRELEEIPSKLWKQAKRGSPDIQWEYCDIESESEDTLKDSSKDTHIDLFAVLVKSAVRSFMPMYKGRYVGS